MARRRTWWSNAALRQAIAQAEGAGRYLTQLSQWIFADGTWSDTGHWQDVREWASAGLFFEGAWWDGGVWDDGEVW